LPRTRAAAISAAPPPPAARFVRACAAHRRAPPPPPPARAPARRSLRRCAAAERSPLPPLLSILPPAAGDPAMAALNAIPAWAKPVDAVLKAYGTDAKAGLSRAEVARRTADAGYNELEKEPATPLWRLVLEQFDDMLVKARAARRCAALLSLCWFSDIRRRGRCV